MPLKDTFGLDKLKRTLVGFSVGEVIGLPIEKSTRAFGSMFPIDVIDVFATTANKPYFNPFTFVGFLFLVAYYLPYPLVFVFTKKNWRSYPLILIYLALFVNVT